MLGFSAIAARPIAGGPFSLVAVSAALAASGALLTFGGTTNPGVIIPASASGILLQFNGSANVHWLQAATTQGTFLIFSGSAELHLLGRPYILTGFREPAITTGQAIPRVANGLADSFTARGS